MVGISAAAALAAANARRRSPAAGVKLAVVADVAVAPTAGVASAGVPTGILGDRQNGRAEVEREYLRVRDRDG